MQIQDYFSKNILYQNLNNEIKIPFYTNCEIFFPLKKRNILFLTLFVMYIIVYYVVLMCVKTYLYKLR